MSGHSKWHNIRVKKGAADAKRGKIYTRHAKLVEIAARAGGGDPSMNAGLRTAVENAKADNVPNANIERAIKKGTGELKGEQMAEVMYAAYGPGNTAFLIECLTDNRNRTLSNVKMLVSKNGGNFAETSSVQWMFERGGLVVARKIEGSEPWSDELELALIDAGAQDIEQDDETITVRSDDAWSQIRDLLKEKGYEIEDSGMKFIATQKTEVTDEQTAEKIAKLMEAIEEDDDVSEVFTNADIVL